MKPTMGRVVFVKVKSSSPDGDGIRSGTINRVREDGKVDVTVNMQWRDVDPEHEGGLCIAHEMMENCAYDESAVPAVGTWHWPPRV